MTSQARALEALLSSSTVREASHLAGVSERQVYRWLALPEFRAKLKAGERERIESAMRCLSSLTGEAVSALASVLAEPEQYGANIKRLAAVSIIELMLKAREQLDIDERLEALERTVRDGKQASN